jgi:hypothetical protein
MKRMVSVHRWLFLLATLLMASFAFGAVRREGTWPEQDPTITVDLTSVTRAEAVRKVADAAGWNVVFKGLPDDRIDVHVKKQPASRVLDMVLADADYIARRENDIIQIRRDDGAARDSQAAPSASAVSPPQAPSPPSPPGVVSPPEPPSPPTPPGKKHKHKSSEDKDRTIFGGSLRVEKTEVVDDIAVFGGSVDILGKATGDVTVFGGSVHIYPEAHVNGNLAVIGGEVKVDDDATVGGDLVALGGDIKRGDRAKVGGEVKVLGEDSGDDDDDHPAEKAGTPIRILRTVGVQLTKTAFLFLIGAVIIAIATRRMELLQSEIALRPMRSMALGIASLVVGTVIGVLLCITIVGIPVAIAALIIAILAGYAGVCAALSTMGRAVVAHRSENPYVHLAVGCGIFLIAGSIPYFGALVTLLIVMAGLGAFAATRAAGFIPANR